MLLRQRHVFFDRPEFLSSEELCACVNALSDSVKNRTDISDCMEGVALLVSRRWTFSPDVEEALNSFTTAVESRLATGEIATVRLLATICMKTIEASQEAGILVRRMVFVLGRLRECEIDAPMMFMRRGDLKQLLSLLVSEFQSRNEIQRRGMLSVTGSIIRDMVLGVSKLGEFELSELPRSISTYDADQVRNYIDSDNSFVASDSIRSLALCRISSRSIPWLVEAMKRAHGQMIVSSWADLVFLIHVYRDSGQVLRSLLESVLSSDSSIEDPIKISALVKYGNVTRKSEASARIGEGTLGLPLSH